LVTIEEVQPVEKKVQVKEVQIGPGEVKEVA